VTDNASPAGTNPEKTDSGTDSTANPVESTAPSEKP
jgi:hypothetical protein